MGGMGRTSDADRRLMDAALTLVWVQGYGAITIDDICRKAGVKKGSFYYFFDSKADLVIAALNRHWQEQKPLWDNHFSPSTAPLQRIRNHCDAVYRQQVAAKQHTARVPGCPFCSLGSEICNQDEAMRARICGILDDKTKYWESAISDAQREGVARAGDVAGRARCAAALFEGLMAQARLRNDAEILASLGDRICEQVSAREGGRAPPPAEAGTEAEKQEEFDATKY